ncbi:PilZ domain-containing protein [Sulfurospirillum sp.]|nr:PilZ domain-containing protein [Sulfurospirillum sp.]
MEENERIEIFLSDSEDFIQKFQPTFVKYFVNLCQSYDGFYSSETLEEVADIVYKDIFVVDIFITTLEKDIFKDMLEDGVMIGFLINKSMFFLLDNYIEAAKKNEISNEHTSTMIMCITEYINQFEKHICAKNKQEPLHLNFDTIENFSSGNNILDIFKVIRDKGEDVMFFNLYKGIPIQHKATIIDIGDGEIAFKTMQTQEIAMKMDGVAYILKDGNFDKYIKADIVYNNFSTNIVVLNNFTYLMNMPAIGREFVRVHPEIMAEVSLSQDEELITKGKLFDLSIDGLGVVSEENNGIYAGAKISIDFTLKISSLEEVNYIQVEAEVLNIIEYSNSYRYCIKIFPKADVEDKIARYVKAREVEILHSLHLKLDDYNF